jgi:endonuclease YncB( thermonuclease family)
MDNTILADFVPYVPFPTDIAEKYPSSVPTEIYDIWKQYGLGSFRNGFVKIINPDPRSEGQGRMKFLFHVFALFLCISAHAGVISGKVVSVADGDTLTLASQNHRVKIRLAGIDAPEKAQPHGEASKQALANAVLQKRVTVRTAAIDHYGRTVGYVQRNGLSINLEQIKGGHAWAYRGYAKDHRYFMAEAEARAKKIGLWRESNPMPPWKFRKAYAIVSKGKMKGRVR